MIRSWLSLLAVAAFTDGHGRPHHDPLTVETTNGPITGHPATNKSSVVEFLGIPYAQPPVGALRFAPPVKYAHSEHQNASTWGFDCPLTASAPSKYPGLTPQAQRILNYFASGTGNPQSEDCLTLNIWTKLSRPFGFHKKPVLVFFYGGRFTIGDTDSPFYNGQFFSDAEDVVVVTVNFRSNIFGYSGAPDQQQNAGLRDQRLAVEWVRDNIAGFGGDSRKITIFGQSSGAVATDWWSYAYEKDPIASGLICHSGNALSFPLNAPGVVTKNWYNVSAQLGCGSSGDTLPCMRNQAWEKILNVSSKLPSSPGGSPLRSIPAFYPVVDNKTVFSDYLSLSKAGKYAKIPAVFGNNDNEQGYYLLTAYARGVNTTKEQGDAFLLSSFTCPSSFEANSRRNHSVPVWQFRYFGDWDNLRLYPGSGAYHGVDLELIFGNSAQVSGIQPSEAEKQLTAVMQKAWAAFANDPARGLSKFGWPEFNPSTESLIRLAYDNSAVPDFVLPSAYDGSCSTVTLAGATTGSG